MKTNNRWALNALLFIAVAFSSMAHAALVGRLAATPGGTDYQAYYDTSANLTWLADMNYAKTTGYDADGRMTWGNAKTWAAGLTVDGVTGWRLPETDGRCFFYSICASHSEMSNLFYKTLGNSVGSCAPNCFAHKGPFNNTPFAASYWTATEFNPAEWKGAPYWNGLGNPPPGWRQYPYDLFSRNTNDAWYLGIGNGSLDNWLKTAHHYAWAVHPGDVKSLVPVVSAVPVPAAIWLFGSGLMGLIGLAKRKTLTLAA